MQYLSQNTLYTNTSYSLLFFFIIVFLLFILFRAFRAFSLSKDICGPYILGWREINLLLKSQNSQADDGSMTIPDQLSPKVFGHRMYQFLRNWPQQIGTLHC